MSYLKSARKIWKSSEGNLTDTPEEEKLLVILENEPLHLDELVRISGFETAEISARLTIMEMKGMVKSMGGGIYKKCN